MSKKKYHEHTLKSHTQNKPTFHHADGMQEHMAVKLQGCGYRLIPSGVRESPVHKSNGIWQKGANLYYKLSPMPRV